jgi:hypothetical protein
MAASSARDAKYPAFRGQWIRNVGAQWDTSKSRGLAQQPPYTPEPNSFAFWDNRCTQHHALWDYYPHSRYGHRVTVCGQKPY